MFTLEEVDVSIKFLVYIILFVLEKRRNHSGFEGGNERVVRKIWQLEICYCLRRKF
jgi:hypothetical protein